MTRILIAHFQASSKWTGWRGWRWGCRAMCAPVPPLRWRRVGTAQWLIKNVTQNHYQRVLKMTGVATFWTQTASLTNPFSSQIDSIWATQVITFPEEVITTKTGPNGSANSADSGNFSMKRPTYNWGAWALDPDQLSVSWTQREPAFHEYMSYVPEKCSW